MIESKFIISRAKGEKREKKYMLHSILHGLKPFNTVSFFLLNIKQKKLLCIK